MTRPDIPWFESDVLERRLARHPVDADTEAFVRKLARDGYATVYLGARAKDLCDEAVKQTDAWFRPGVRQVQDAWRRSRAVRRLAAWPRLRTLLRAAYGRDPFPFETVNVQQGGAEAMTSETSAHGSVPDRFICGVCIALEDVKPEAGPLTILPRSHRQPAFSLEGVMGPPEAPAPARAARSSGQQEAILKKGWALVWAASLAHGGAPIQDPKATRRSLLVRYYFEDCLYYAPATSNLAAGRLDLRLPSNVRTGRWVWPTRNGRPALPRFATVLAAAWRDLRRRPLTR